MKLLKCIVPEEKLENIKHVLLSDGIQGMTIFPVKGFGIHGAQLSQKVSRNYLVEFQPRVMIEIVFADSSVEKVIKLLTTVAKTGRLGDGKVFVLPVEEAVRIRTGERGEAAL
jgi:nitrogen regulatory protein P-II 1